MISIYCLLSLNRSNLVWVRYAILVMLLYSHVPWPYFPNFFQYLKEHSFQYKKYYLYSTPFLTFSMVFFCFVISALYSSKKKIFTELHKPVPKEWHSKKSSGKLSAPRRLCLIKVSIMNCQSWQLHISVETIAQTVGPFSEQKRWLWNTA